MHNWLAQITGRQRLLLVTVLGLVLAFIPSPMTRPSQSLLAWCIAVLVYLLLAWQLAMHFDARQTRERAQSQDQPGMILFAVVLVSIFVSIAAITLMLPYVRDLSAVRRYGHLALSMFSLGSSWLLMQTIFAFRYAYLYYQVDAHTQSHGAGLDFPGKLAPDYFDFLYYAHVVGMTSQVSDVVITARPMRHLTLFHSIVAFAFNMLVLALSINVIAGAI